MEEMASEDCKQLDRGDGYGIVGSILCIPKNEEIEFENPERESYRFQYHE